MAGEKVTRIGPDLSEFEHGTPAVQTAPKAGKSSAELKTYKEDSGAVRRENGTYAPASYPLPSGNTREDH